MQRKRIAILLLVLAGLGAWFVLDLGSYLQLEVLQARVDELRTWRDARPLAAGGLYFVVYILVTGLSLPGAGIMTLAGGALFGFWYALALVSFASSIGASLAFLVSRVLLRDWVQQRFAAQLHSVNRGFARDGGFYLLSLRLVPLFPFFLVNLLMGLLPISLRRFYWVSQLGMLPVTAVFVNAGRELGQLQDLSGIVSPGLLSSLVLLALFPFLARWLLERLRQRLMLGRFRRPRRFDNNLIVIGAGSAGLVASLVAATVRARVTLVERHRMGGDCLNTGCVPSKALIRSARIAAYARRASEFGLAPMDVRVRFPEVMRRVQSIVSRIEPNDSVERYTALGVNCLQGDARLVSPWEVEVDGRRISGRQIVIASGARPTVPEIPGLERLDYLTSDTIWTLCEAPASLLVLGGGPIGCELAQALAQLGVEVTLVSRSARLLPREDDEISDILLERFTAQGITVRLGAEPLGFQPAGPGGSGRFRAPEGEFQVEFERLLLAVGRTPNTEGLGLHDLGVELTANGFVAVDSFLRTTLPTVYACGDVAGPFQFTHMAGHQAWYAAVNALFGGLRKFRVNYSVVPRATFTDPEVARVGLNEREARELGRAVEVTRYDLADLDRAIADGEASGFIKVLTAPGRDRILGATIVGHHAGDLIAEFVLAMTHGIGLNKLLGTIHVYPTLAEGNKFAAGEWRKARKPEKLLSWLARYHAFLRR